MRDVDEFRNSVLLRDASDRFGASHMYGVEVKVPRKLKLDAVIRERRLQILGLVVPSDKIIHDIRVP